MKWCDFCNEDTLYVKVNDYEEVCFICVFVPALFKGRKFKRIDKKFKKKD